MPFVSGYAVMRVRGCTTCATEKKRCPGDDRRRARRCTPPRQTRKGRGGEGHARGQTKQLHTAHERGVTSVIDPAAVLCFGHGSPWGRAMDVFGGVASGAVFHVSALNRRVGRENPSDEHAHLLRSRVFHPLTKLDAARLTVVVWLLLESWAFNAKKHRQDGVRRRAA